MTVCSWFRALSCTALVAASACSAQGLHESVTGAVPFEHVGSRIVGSVRLSASSSDSTWLVVVGSSSIRTVRPGGPPGSIAIPSGATGAFGSGAASISGFASHNRDAVAVGDPGFSQGRGRVSIYFGGPGFAGLPSLTLEGQSSGDLFGAAVADVGDVNGDGYNDLGVGAPGRNSGTGYVSVYLGGPTPSATAAVTVNGYSERDLFGTAITAGGDLDQDGYGDYVIGAPGGAEGVGMILVVHGQPGSPATRTQVVTFQGGPLTYESNRPRFGAALLGGKDLDGDGVLDLVVGAPGLAEGRGRAYLLHEAGGGISQEWWEFGGETAFDGFGSALAAGPFVNPSKLDLAVGAPGMNEGRGAAVLYYGGTSFDAEPDVFVLGSDVDDAFGTSVASARLFRQAPASQLVAGAPFADLGAPNAGAAFFYAVPPAVAVEQTALSIESDGNLLQPNAYTSTRPRFSLRLGSGSIDLATAEVTIDGVKQDVRSMSEQGAGAPSHSLASVELAVAELTEGPHELRAKLYDMAHSVVGTAQLTFIAAARLRIESPQVVPNPAVSAAHLVFTLTRPAAYQFRLFDVSGRQIFHQAAIGEPAENRVRLGWDSNRPSPGMYFYVLDASYQQQRSSARGRLVLTR